MVINEIIAESQPSKRRKLKQCHQKRKRRKYLSVINGREMAYRGGGGVIAEIQSAAAICWRVWREAKSRRGVSCGWLWRNG
jgi:hypothetical protein